MTTTGTNHLLFILLLKLNISIALISEITDLLLVAQTFVFFVAGFETTSRTLHFLIYQLAQHQEVQNRAREEVQKVKATHGRFSYDALKDMTFLNKCISGIDSFVF